MRILLASPRQENSNGGIAVWTESYLAACESAGLEVTLVNTAAIGKRLENGSARRSPLDEIVRTRKIFRSLKAALKGERYDAVHINTSCGTFGIIRDYLMAKRIKKKQPEARLVVQYHCDIPAQIRTPRAKKYLGKLLALGVRSLVLCSGSAEYLRREFGADSRAVPNFINEDYIRRDPKEISGAVRRAFFVGRVQPSKGAREIYELSRRFPDIEFRLAGAVSSAMTEEEKPEGVTLLGPLPHADVLREMDEADIFVFPSHTEGFSVALMESMARGLPALATDVGAGADMLSDGCGIIVQKGDVDAMAAAITELSSQAVRSAISNAARRRTAEEYTADAVMRIFSEEYKKP
ncbi:MAG: glycosyltransferase family 4 protein [Clostridia bacterium]|nr:glycosyltransferase family 4 protein [Clostridia bacterium]